MERKKKKHTTRKSSTTKTQLGDRDILSFKVLKPEILLIVVFILALFIRLIYLNQIIPTPILHGLVADAEKYDNLALQIMKGNLTYKEFIYLNPLYPFFLALIYLVCGHSHTSVVIIQGIIDSISCILIYYIASMLFNKKVAILAAFIYAFYGIAIFYTGILLAPTVVVFFTLLFIASLLAAQEKRQGIIFFISGILFGLTVLARPNVTLFLLFLPLWFFTTLKSKLGINKSMQGLVCLLVGFFLVISLISIRNYSIERQFTPSFVGGINFYIGNNPQARGYFMFPHGISDSPVEQVKTSILYAGKESGKSLTPSQSSRYWLLKGLTFIKDNPQDALFLYIKKFVSFWRKEEIPQNINYTFSKTFASILQLPFFSFGIIAPFALLGIILSLRKKNAALVNLFILSYMLSVIIFFVSARYRLLIVPLLIIFSSYSLYRFVAMIRAKEFNHITIQGAVLILLFVSINKNFKYFTTGPSSRHHSNLGRVYKMDGRFDEAISEFKKALTIDPNFAMAHSNLGATYISKNMLDDGVTECKRALTIDPNFAMAHYNLGIAYAKKGRLDEAISEYERSIAIRPDYPEVLINLGIIYVRKGRLEAAIISYKKAISLNPNFANVHYNLGNVYLKKGQLDMAISEYKRALTINPNYAKAHSNLGNAYFKKGDYNLAIEHCDRAIKLGIRINPRLLRNLEHYR